MIAITAYTEPIAVNTVNDPPRIQENERDEDPSKISQQGGFAEILARLLRDSETPAEINENAYLSETVEFEGEELSNGKENPLWGFIEKASAEIPQEIPEMLSASLTDDQLPVVDLEVDFDAESFQQKIANLINSEHLPEAELDNDFFMVDPSMTVAAQTAAANAAANAAAEELLNAEAGGRRERNAFKIENIELFAAKNVRSEDSDAIRKEPANEKMGRLDELRSNRSRRDKITFEVRDQRIADAQGTQSAQTRTFTAVEASAARVQGEGTVREITLELRLPDQNHGAAQTQTIEAKASTALENMLARELHQNFNGDIVRHASIALRDGGEGTIKIALKPESLGNVKIALELVENKITGKIIVESEEAMNAFRKEIASLEQTFRDSGFTNAELNLSMAAEGQNAQSWDMDTSSFIPRMIADRYDESFEYDALKLIDVFAGQKYGSINMLA